MGCWTHKNEPCKSRLTHRGPFYTFRYVSSYHLNHHMHHMIPLGAPFGRCGEYINAHYHEVRSTTHEPRTSSNERAISGAANPTSKFFMQYPACLDVLPLHHSRRITGFCAP